MTTKTRRQAKKAYAEHRDAIEATIKKLNDRLADLDFDQDRDRGNWTFVGTAEHISESLSQLAREIRA